jgi:hypothetical protein
VKAISLWQPWASLLACGAKQYETRSWATKYRGLIAIHAAKKPYSHYDYSCSFYDAVNKARIGPLPYGVIVATAELVECWECIGRDRRGDLMLHNGREGVVADNRYIGDDELLFGDFTKGRYAWEFANMTPLTELIPTTGRQGLWNWEGGGEA